MDVAELLGIAAGALVGAIAGGYLQGYLREKGQQLARKEDLDKIVAEVAKITETTEAIKADVSSDLWKKHTIWTERWLCYNAILTAITEFREAKKRLALHYELSDKAPDRLKDLDRLTDESREANIRLNQARTKAHLLLGPRVGEALAKYQEQAIESRRTPVDERDRRWWHDEATQLEELRMRIIDLGKAELGLNEPLGPGDQKD